MDAMRSCPDNVKVFTVAGTYLAHSSRFDVLLGSRDIGGEISREASWVGYELAFMESFYYFKLGERYYIGLDSQASYQNFDLS